MHTTANTQVAVLAALTLPVAPARKGSARLAGALASLAVAVGLLQTVATAFHPAGEHAAVVAAAQPASTVR